MAREYLSTGSSLHRDATDELLRNLANIPVAARTEDRQPLEDPNLGGPLPAFTRGTLLSWDHPIATYTITPPSPTPRPFRPEEVTVPYTEVDPNDPRLAPMLRKYENVGTWDSFIGIDPMSLGATTAELCRANMHIEDLNEMDAGGAPDYVVVSNHRIIAWVRNGERVLAQRTPVSNHGTHLATLHKAWGIKSTAVSNSGRPNLQASETADYIKRRAPFTTDGPLSAKLHTSGRNPSLGILDEENINKLRGVSSSLYVVYTGTTPVAWWSPDQGWHVVSIAPGDSTRTRHTNLVKSALGM